MNFIFPKLIFQVERWKYNKEYDIYVSNMGHCRDNNKNSIPINISQSGYITIKTTNGFTSVHRLVLKTFRPTKDMDNLTVDHLDHNKRNNCLSNLEWVTKEENERRAAADLIGGVMPKPKIKVKRNEFNGKVLKIRKIGTKKYGTISFKSWEEVGAWLMRDQGMLYTDPDRIGNRVKKVCANNKPYCGYYYKLEKE